MKKITIPDTHRFSCPKCKSKTTYIIVRQAPMHSGGTESKFLGPCMCRLSIQDEEWLVQDLLKKGL